MSLPIVGVEAVLVGAGTFRASALIVNGALAQLDRAAANTAKNVTGNLSGIGVASDVAFNAIRIGALATATAIAGFTVATSAAVTAGLKFDASLEQNQISFETLLKSGRAASAFLEELGRFAARTPFRFPELVESTQMLMRYGFAAKDVLPLLEDIGNVASAAGKLNQQAYERIAYALGQVRTAGRVLGQDLRQLYDAGVSIGAIFEIIAKNTGKTTAEVYQLQRTGKLASDEFIKAFQEWSRRDFGGLMERQSHVFLGAWNTIVDNVEIGAGKAFGPLFERVSRVTDAFAQFTRTDDWTRWTAKVAAAVEAVMRVIEDIGGFVATVFSNTVSIISNSVNMIIRGLNALGQAFSIILGGILDIVITVGRAIYNALQWLNPFARHSPSLVEQVEIGMDNILQAYKKLGAQMPPALQDASDAMTNFKNVIEDAWNRIEDKTQNAIDKDLARLGSDIPAAYNAAVEAVNKMIGKLSDLNSEIHNQQDVVDEWKRKVDDAREAINSQERAIKDAERALRPYQDAVNNAREALNKAQEALQASKEKVSKLKSEISQAEDIFKGFTKATLEGSKYFSDALFDNEQQVKALQLEINKLKMSQQPSKEVQELTDQLEAAKKVQDDLAESLRELKAGDRPSAEMVALKSQIEAATNVQKGLSIQLEEAKMSHKPVEGLIETQKASDDAESKVKDLQIALEELKVNKAPKEQIDKATDSLDAAQLEARKLKNSLDKLKDADTAKLNSELSSIQSSLDDSELATKKLQLELDKLQLSGAPAAEIAEVQKKLDDAKTNVFKLDEALQKAKGPNEEIQKKIDLLEAKLKELQTVGENIKLEESLQLDPLRKKLEEVANTSKELTFEEAMAGAIEWKAKLDDLNAALVPAEAEVSNNEEAVKNYKDAVDAAEKSLNVQKAAIDAQKDALDALRETLEKIQDSHDKESDKLSKLKEAYSAVSSEVAKYRQQLEEAARKAEQLRKEAETAAKKGGAGAEKPMPPGFGGPGFTDEEIAKMEEGAKIFKEQYAASLASVTEKIQGFVESLHNVENVILVVNDRIKRFFDLLSEGNDPLTAAQTAFKNIFGLDTDTFFNNIRKITDKITELTTNVSNLVTSLDEFKTVIEKTKSPMIDIGTGIESIRSFIVQTVGPMDGFNDAMRKFSEKIGPMLSDLIKDISRELGPEFVELLEHLSDLAKAFLIDVAMLAKLLGVTFVAAIIEVVKDLNKFVPALKVILEGVNLFATVLSDIANNRLDKLGGDIQKHFDKFQKEANDSWLKGNSNVDKRLEEQLGIVKNRYKDQTETVRTNLETVDDISRKKWTGLGQWLDGRWTSDAENADKKFTTLGSNVEKNWKSIDETAQSKWTTIGEGLDGAWNGIIDDANTKFGTKEGLGADMAKAWDDIDEIDKNKWSILAQNLSDSWQGVRDDATVKFGEQGIQGDLDANWNTINENSATAWDSINETIDQRFVLIAQSAGINVDSIVAFFGDIPNRLNSLTESIGNAAYTIGETIYNGILSPLGMLWQGIQDMINNAISNIRINLPGVSSPAPAPPPQPVYNPPVYSPDLPPSTGGELPPDFNFVPPPPDYADPNYGVEPGGSGNTYSMSIAKDKAGATGNEPSSDSTIVNAIKVGNTAINNTLTRILSAVNNLRVVGGTGGITPPPPVGGTAPIVPPTEADIRSLLLKNKGLGASETASFAKFYGRLPGQGQPPGVGITEYNNWIKILDTNAKKITGDPNARHFPWQTLFINKYGRLPENMNDISSVMEGRKWTDWPSDFEGYSYQPPKIPELPGNDITMPPGAGGPRKFVPNEPIYRITGDKRPISISSMESILGGGGGQANTNNYYYTVNADYYQIQSPSNIMLDLKALIAMTRR